MNPTIFQSRNRDSFYQNSIASPFGQVQTTHSLTLRSIDSYHSLGHAGNSLTSMANRYLLLVQCYREFVYAVKACWVKRVCPNPFVRQ